MSDQSNTVNEGNAPRMVTKKWHDQIISQFQGEIGVQRKRLEEVTAQRDQFETMYKDELTWYNDMKAQRDELLAAIKDALASWATENALTYEVVESMNAAIAKAERSAQ